VFFLCSSSTAREENEDMAGMKTALFAVAGTAAALALLGACDNGPSAVQASTQAAGTQIGSAENAPARRAAAAVDHRNDAVKLVDGKPIWSASRRYSAEEAARRAFERNGEAFGARSLDQYVKKAHAFVEHPPAGTQTLTRSNGDMLFYDPKANVFAVASKAGAPRTMFKPDDGAAYWAKQKDLASRQTARAGKRRAADDEA
jgi:pyocin large subunit-like protein